MNPRTAPKPTASRRDPAAAAEAAARPRSPSRGAAARPLLAPDPDPPAREGNARGARPLVRAPRVPERPPVSVPDAKAPGESALTGGLRAIANAMSEAELQARITSGTRREPGICAQLGLAWHHHRISKGSTPGWPDLVIGKAPNVLFWELKTERGKVTPAQQAWLDLLASAGNPAGVRRPSDLLSGRIARELAALAGIGGAR